MLRNWIVRLVRKPDVRHTAIDRMMLMLVCTCIHMHDTILIYFLLPKSRAHAPLLSSPVKKNISYTKSIFLCFIFQNCLDKLLGMKRAVFFLSFLTNIKFFIIIQIYNFIISLIGVRNYQQWKTKSKYSFRGSWFFFQYNVCNSFFTYMYGR